MINEKKNKKIMIYLNILKWTNHFNAFDSLSETELKVSLNKIFSVYPGCQLHDYDVENECGLTK